MSDCIRCGMCCVAMPCLYSPEYETENDDCSYLYIHKDLHTSCLCAVAQRAFIGTGCLFAESPEKHKELRDLQCVLERKKEMRNEQLARIRCAT